MPVNCHRVLGFVAFASMSLVVGSSHAASIPLIRQTTRDAILLHRRSYNYAPAMIRDGATTHLYWCAGVAGDYILHLAAPSPAGPWLSWQAETALKPTGSPANFDGLHTCDPNVLKVGATFYLYYTGAAKEGGLSTIGVAASRDGARFERLNAGKPIVVPAMSNPAWAATHLTYGAGQPAATFIAPYVYLSFTDSTGAGGNPINGAGQYLLRSTDPAFSRDVEELSATGWVPRRPGEHNATYAYIESFGLDLAYDRPSGLVLAVSDSVAGETSLFALDPLTFHPLARGDIPLDWHEGPALLAEADKSTAPRANCASIDIEVLAAEGASADPFTWHALGASVGSFSLAGFCPAPRP
jgi:hypothetical protein